MLSYADWQAERLAALTAPTGWLNLTDRVAIAAGPQRVGAGAGNDIMLSSGPEDLGVLTVSPEGAALTMGAKTLAFQAVEGGGPQLAIAGMILEIHWADGEPALRVRQVDHPARTGFAGLRSFPFDPAWVKTARWERLSAPETATIAMKGGRQDAVIVTHRALFDHDGRQIILTPTHWKAGKPMFVIRDATAGRETYAASRFLIGEDASDSDITLDFNRAHNPPCAYSDLAICPLPPPGNVLAFAIRAGELAPGGQGHPDATSVSGQ